MYGGGFTTKKCFDFSGYGNNGTPTNGPTVVTSPYGRAVNSNAADTCLTVSTVPRVTDVRPLTAVCCVNAVYNTTAGVSLFDKTEWQFILEESGNNWRARFYVDGSGGDVTALTAYDSAGSLYADQWVHLAVTWTGEGANGSAKLYRNGIDVTDSCTGAGTPKTDAAYDLKLATGNANGGLLASHFCLYNRVLSPNRLQQLYADGFAHLRLCSDVYPLAGLPPTFGGESYILGGGNSCILGA